MNNNHPVKIVAKKYPQMLLPIRNGEKDTEEYKNAVLRGSEISSEPDFSFNERDTFEIVETPAGKVDVLTLVNRDDFVHCIRALAHRCEEVQIPQSMGASTIFGLINWEKIRAHEDNLDEFLSDKKNYIDGIIVLSYGSYSNIDTPSGMENDDWLEKSLIIRKYHELTHFVSRNLFIENKEDIRDEVIADMMGLVCAFGTYDTVLARTFLGIEGESYRQGGRLQNYISDNNIQPVVDRTNKLIDTMSAFLTADGKSYSKINIFDLLEKIESSKIGL